MARVLLINPNTTATVTARLAPVLAGELGGEHELACATARFGADYISSEAAYCIAGHATLDALASAGAGADHDDMSPGGQAAAFVRARRSGAVAAR